MAPIIRVVLKLAVVGAELYDRYRRSREEEKRQEQYDRAKRDPVGAFDEHFNRVSDEPKQTDKTPKAGTPESDRE